MQCYWFLCTRNNKAENGCRLNYPLMHSCANWRHHYTFHFIQNCAYQKPSKVNVSLGSSGPPMVPLGFMSLFQMHPIPRRFRFADSWPSRYVCLLFRSFNISCQFLLYQTWEVGRSEKLWTEILRPCRAFGTDQHRVDQGWFLHCGVQVHETLTINSFS